MNICTATDSYKLGHWMMLPKGTQKVNSYFESREGSYFPETVFFGLQSILIQNLVGEVVTWDKIEEGKLLTKYHLGNEKYFNYEMWKYIIDMYDGCLPIEIKAVPEGTHIPTNNVLMNIVNTDDKCAALTNHLETILSQVWYPCTVCTLSREIKKKLNIYNEQTSNQPNNPFGLHDFGYRGVSSVQSAGLGASAHLVNFFGTDTIRGIEDIMKYYNGDLKEIAFSVIATEHSIMTSLGELGEKQILLNLLNLFPSGILSVVIDSYNYRRFIHTYAKEFRDMILARDGKTVFRPDSGDPVLVTLDCLELLGNVFGYTINNKGYKELVPKVGLLWGDGVGYDDIIKILEYMKVHKWASCNIIFGMGGGLLQKSNRDTQRFAFKCNAQMRDNQWFDIYKNPIDQSKRSKKGLIKLIKEDSIYKTVKTNDSPLNDELVTVFLNGHLIRKYSFNEVRENAKL